jgi:hypothetical protein
MSDSPVMKIGGQVNCRTTVVCDVGSREYTKSEEPGRSRVQKHVTYYFLSSLKAWDQVLVLNP